MSQTDQHRPTQRANHDATHKHLIFTVGHEEFGIGVLHIKEIIQMQEITPVPKSPPDVKGVINLRGQVIPVLDLAVRFNMERREYTPRTCIVVVRQCFDGGERLIGAVADGVNEVLSIAEEDIEQSPEFGSGNTQTYIRGMAKVRDQVKLLLNTERVFTLNKTQKGN